MNIEIANVKINKTIADESTISKPPGFIKESESKCTNDSTDISKNFERLNIDTVLNTKNNTNKAEDKITENSIQKTNALDESDKISESDAHLPRVRIELDRLNYANESINNLELELEESKREFIETLRSSETGLSQLEKKIGSHVIKSMSYYEERMALNLAKQKYLNAKFEFETAQELYVAAKNMQMYAEENLENATEVNKNSVDTMILVKMLKMAKVKVSEAEFSKQSCDMHQIEEFKIYDSLQKKMEQTEKRLKTSIVKSLKYYQAKAKFNKELKFFWLKIEGLKSCLREAKTAYQQSLKNLEKISTEVHAQRSFNKASSNSSLIKHVSPNSSYSTISSMTGIIVSHSSPNLTSLDNQKSYELTRKSKSLTILTNSKSENSQAQVEVNKDSEEEDYDVYFTESFLKNESNNNGVIKTVHYNQKLDKNAICLLSDEDIESLRLDKKLKKFENELLNRKNTEEVFIKKEQKSQENTSSNFAVSTPNRPQFRVPFFSKQRST